MIDQAWCSRPIFLQYYSYSKSVKLMGIVQCHRLFLVGQVSLGYLWLCSWVYRGSWILFYCLNIRIKTNIASRVCLHYQVVFYNKLYNIDCWNFLKLGNLYDILRIDHQEHIYINSNKVIIWYVSLIVRYLYKVPNFYKLSFRNGGGPKKCQGLVVGGPCPLLQCLMLT